MDAAVPVSMGIFARILPSLELKILYYFISDIQTLGRLRAVCKRWTQILSCLQINLELQGRQLDRFRDWDLFVLTEKFPWLRKLSLYGCSLVTTASIAYAARFRRVELLRVGACKSLRAVSERLNGSRFTALKILDLRDGPKVEDEDMEGIASIVTLQSLWLDLPAFGATNEGLEKLTSLTNLVHLYLGKDSSDRSYTALEFVGQLPQLKYLYFGSLSDSCLESLVRKKALDHIRVLGLLKSELHDPSIQLIRRLQNLNVLRLQSCPYISEKGIGGIVMMPTLRTLNVLDCVRVDPVQLDVLQALLRAARQPKQTPTDSDLDLD
jgi:hypothetical protein